MYAVLNVYDIIRRHLPPCIFISRTRVIIRHAEAFCNGGRCCFRPSSRGLCNITLARKTLAPWALSFSKLYKSHIYRLSSTHPPRKPPTLVLCIYFMRDSIGCGMGAHSTLIFHKFVRFSETRRNVVVVVHVWISFRCLVSREQYTHLNIFTVPREYFELEIELHMNLG